MLDQGVGWSTGYLFWPPPPASDSELGATPAVVTLGEAEALLEGELRAAGYEDERWLAIGAHGEHGLAAVTRIERIDEDGRPRPGSERWLQQYPAAPSLQWLGAAATPYLPKAGRYRIFLVALTDLIVRGPGQPQRWDETTAMEGPGPTTAAIPAARRVPPNARLGVWVYEFECKAGENEGALVTSDGRVSVAQHLARAGLSALAALGSHP
jgi:hypothetical protein